MELKTNFFNVKNTSNGDLIITLTKEGENELEDLKNSLDEQQFQSDDTMFDFMEEIVANSELQWLSPGFDLDVLTDAPILGIQDESGQVPECYAFMDYQVISVQESLYTHGQAIWKTGQE